MKIALNPPQWALAGACMLLASLLFYEVAAPLAPFDPPPLTLKRRAFTTRTVFFSPPSLASFAVIDARTLFSPSRKPADAPQTPGAGPVGPAAPPPPPNVMLIGVIIDSDKQLALVKAPGAPFAASLHVGDLLDGWQVTKIGPDAVVLRAGTIEHILEIGDQRAGKSQPLSANGAAAPSIPASAAVPAAPPKADLTTIRPPVPASTGAQ